jgi:hypothetical protein
VVRSPGIRNSGFGKPVTAASGNGSYAQRGYTQVSYSGLPVITGSLFPFLRDRLMRPRL